MDLTPDRPARAIVVSLFASVALASAASAEPGPAAVPPVITEAIQVADTMDAGSAAGVPVDAAAAVLNVTVTRPGDAGFVAVTPCTPGPVTTSNLNFRDDQDVAGTVLARLSDDGRICVNTSASADVVVDVSGYLPAGSSLMPLSAPVRGVDTRSGLGVANTGQRLAGSTTMFDVGAVSGVPNDVGTAVLNVTAVGAMQAGFVTVEPCGGATPSTSTLNLVPGRDIANLAVTAVASNGTVCITTTVGTHLIVDVFATAPASAADPVMLSTPVRAVDSRNGTGTTATPFGPIEREVRLGHVPGLTTGAGTAFVNVTTTRAAAAGFVSLHDCGATPDNSNVNFVAGIDVANAAIVSLDSGGATCVTASTDVDVVIDVVGAAVSPSTIVTFDPVRIHDTRSLAVPQCNVALSPPVGDSFTLTNLTDFTITVVRSPAVATATSSNTRIQGDITPDCDAIVLGFGSSTQSPIASVVRVALDGTSTTVGIPGAHRTDAVLSVGDSGQVVSLHSDGAVDVATGQVLLTLPATLPDESYRPLGLATDTTYAYFHEFGDGRRQVEIYPAGVSPAPDEVIALPNDIPHPFRFDDFATGFDGVRSPAGRYRLIGNPGTLDQVLPNVGLVSTAALQPTVTGPAGVPVVNSTPMPTIGPAHWLAEGLVILCASSAGRVYSWPVLDDPVVIPLLPCPIAVR